METSGQLRLENMYTPLEHVPECVYAVFLVADSRM